MHTVPQQTTHVQNAGISSAFTNLDGALCGSSAEGNYVSIGQALAAVDGRIQTWGTDGRDGWVSVPQCKAVAPAITWGSTTSEVFTVLPLNYADTTCRFGNPIADPTGASSPCNWYRHVASQY